MAKANDKLAKAGKKRRERKNIEKGAVHIQSTFNNTIVTITDVNGNAISWASAGELGFKGKRMFGAFCAVLLLSFAAEGFGKIVSELSLLAEGTGISNVARDAVKLVGAGYVFGVGSDIADELGEGGAARALSVVGRVEIALLILPYFAEILKTGTGLIK